MTKSEETDYKAMVARAISRGWLSFKPQPELTKHIVKFPKKERAKPHGGIISANWQQEM